MVARGGGGTVYAASSKGAVLRDMWVRIPPAASGCPCEAAPGGGLLALLHQNRHCRMRSSAGRALTGTGDNRRSWTLTGAWRSFASCARSRGGWRAPTRSGVPPIAWPSAFGTPAGARRSSRSMSSRRSASSTRPTARSASRQPAGGRASGRRLRWFCSRRRRCTSTSTLASIWSAGCSFAGRHRTSSRTAGRPTRPPAS